MPSMSMGALTLLIGVSRCASVVVGSGTIQHRVAMLAYFRWLDLTFKKKITGPGTY